MKKAILIGSFFLSSIFGLKAQSDSTAFSPEEKREVDRMENVISAYKGADSTAYEDRLRYIGTLINYQTLLENKIDLEKAANENRLQEVQDLAGMRRILHLEMRLGEVNDLLGKEMEIGLGRKTEAKNVSVPTKQP